MEVFSKNEWDGLVDKLNLSHQQAKIIECLFKGLRDKQIAADMGISIPTVRTHFARMFIKYGVQDRVELIVHIFQNFRTDCNREECPFHHLQPVS